MTNFAGILLPFDDQTQLPVQVSVTGSLNTSNELQINYQVTGDVDTIEFASPHPTGQRTDNLWQRTCFEVFVKIADDTRYWEYNFSPSLNWAVYGFTDYRANNFDEVSITSIPITVSAESDQFELNAQTQLPEPLIEQNLQIGLSTVLKDKQGALYYYALQHNKNQADFHDATSFIVNITR